MPVAVFVAPDVVEEAFLVAAGEDPERAVVDEGAGDGDPAGDGVVRIDEDVPVGIGGEIAFLGVPLVLMPAEGGIDVLGVLRLRGFDDGLIPTLIDVGADHFLGDLEEGGVMEEGFAGGAFMIKLGHEGAEAGEVDGFLVVGGLFFDAGDFVLPDLLECGADAGDGGVVKKDISDEEALFLELLFLVGGDERVFELDGGGGGGHGNLVVKVGPVTIMAWGRWVSMGSEGEAGRWHLDGWLGLLARAVIFPFFEGRNF